MPLDEWNIGVQDLDRKLKSLRAMHGLIIKNQPDCFFDVIQDYFWLPDTQSRYGYTYNEFQGHPDDNGYLALADFFAEKIGLNT